MSFFDDASLVMIPSGYKDQKVYSVKPTDGTGDLTFSRASSATRVQSNGLIEKVRTNLLLQSNTFNTTWTLDDATLTSGQSGYDGTNNAWRLAKTAAGGRVQQTLSLSSNSHTFSVYVKAGTKNWVFLRADGTSNRTSYFNLQTGVVGTASGCTPSIVSAGNGWYRCSISYVDTITSARIWVADADGDISGTSGNILIQAAQVETGDIATAYIATTTAAVSVGPVSGLPRLDYLGSTCPRLLLEPQRTNLALYSEQLNNAAWVNDQITISANTTISPDGYQNADTATIVTSGSNLVTQVISVSASTTYTFSFYVKRGTATDLRYSIYDVTNAANIVAPTTYYSQTSSSQWVRISFTFTTPVGCLSIACYPIRNATSTGTAFLYGCQLEAAAYATSYIPTLGASVTRVGDAAFKTSASALIGQTEGTIYAEWNASNVSTSGRVIAIGDGTFANRIVVLEDGNGIRVFISTSSVVQADLSPLGSYVGTHKIAVAYANNDLKVYIDGVAVATQTTLSVPPCSALYVGTFENGTDQQPLGGGMAQTLLFKTRLTNAQLAELTA